MSLYRQTYVCRIILVAFQDDDEKEDEEEEEEDEEDKINQVWVFLLKWKQQTILRQQLPHPIFNIPLPKLTPTIPFQDPFIPLPDFRRPSIL